MSKSRKYLTLLALSLSGGSIYMLPYLKYVFYDPVLTTMHINNEQMGFLLTMYAIGCIVLYIPGGLIADRVSAKKALIFSLLGTTALTLLYAFTFNYVLAQIIWVLLAITTAFVFWSALLKTIRMISNADEQGRMYGLYYAGNGTAGAIISSLGLWAFAQFDDPAQGLRAAVLVFAFFTTLAAILVAIFFKEDKSKDVSTAEEEKFHFKDVTGLLKNPLLWLIAFTIFCTYGLYTSGSYFIPYLTNVIGVPVEGSSALGIIRTYAFMLICAPLGGFIADKMKSTTKWFLIAFSILIALYVVILLLPKGANMTFVIILSLLPGAVSLMMYGIMFSVVGECRIPLRLTGTAVGIASIIGYLPDFAFNTLFGGWLDSYGNNGYRYIFMFLLGLGVIGLTSSYLIRRRTKNLPALEDDNRAKIADESLLG